MAGILALTSVDLVAYLKYNVEDDSVMDRLALVRSIYVFVLIDLMRDGKRGKEKRGDRKIFK